MRSQRDIGFGTFLKMLALKNCLSSTVMLIYSKDLTEYITKLLIQVPKVTFFLSSPAEPILYTVEHSSYFDGE